jgi:hypothetical protein
MAKQLQFINVCSVFPHTKSIPIPMFGFSPRCAEQREAMASALVA